MTLELIHELETRHGYRHVRKVPNHGICGIRRLFFTTGVFCQLDESGYGYRYCYHDETDAVAALENWQGEDHPPGNWIVRKGRGGDYYQRRPLVSAPVIDAVEEGGAS